jgi:hypothetical protein
MPHNHAASLETRRDEQLIGDFIRGQKLEFQKPRRFF